MHLGVIPDGNRRYASEKGVENREAYEEAKDTMIEIFNNDDGIREKIDEVTFYLLSEENLKRDEEELETLFDLIEENIQEYAEEFGENDFSFNWVATKPGALPGHLRKKLREMEEKFDSGEKTLNALIGYTGKKDIAQAARRIQNSGQKVNVENLEKKVAIKSEIDYVIRTGDNPRRECLSGFPIWNSSYAEFYHVQKNFPELTVEDVEEAFQHFEDLRRRKGE